MWATLSLGENIVLQCFDNLFGALLSGLNGNGVGPSRTDPGFPTPESRMAVVDANYLKFAAPSALGVLEQTLTLFPSTPSKFGQVVS